MNAPELTVVVPTFNERVNVDDVISRLDEVLKGIAWEAVFVDDDSPDGTADRIFEINRERPDIRCLKRVGRRGLSSACIEGICSSSSPYVAVMDADLQHDESIFPAMLAKLRDEKLDIVVGSRFTEGGSTGTMPGVRVKMSRFATWIGTKVLGVETTDPMSGFFMVNRDFFYQTIHHLSGKGFKILLDIFASSKVPVRFGEVPYNMRAREHGDSKLDTVVLWEYLLLLCEKTFGKYIPVRFVFFVMMGLLGSVFHLVVLFGAYYGMGTAFVTAQSLAVVTAMTANYFFNNMFTYSDRRNRGWRNLRGLLIFYLSCSSGAAINIIVATYLFERGILVAFAGLLGAGVGAVWNYSLSSQYAWRKPGESHGS